MQPIPATQMLPLPHGRISTDGDADKPQGYPAKALPKSHPEQSSRHQRDECETDRLFPHFTEEDIPELLKYAEDLTIIPSFPSVYNTNNGKIRLGECMLWVIESIRQGTAPSLGCRMVLANAENYEAIYFLTDDEVLDAAACYRRWWEGRKYPKTTWTIDPCYDEPLCGSGYRWW